MLGLPGQAGPHDGDEAPCDGQATEPAPAALLVRQRFLQVIGDGGGLGHQWLAKECRSVTRQSRPRSEAFRLSPPRNFDARQHLDVGTFSSVSWSETQGNRPLFVELRVVTLVLAATAPLWGPERTLARARPRLCKAPESMPRLTERERVERARTGDEEAFGQLVRRHQPRIHRLAAHMLRDRAEAEDVAQETFIRAYRALARFDGRSEPYTWLYRIAVNLSPETRCGPQEVPQDFDPGRRSTPGRHRRRAAILGRSAGGRRAAPALPGAHGGHRQAVGHTAHHAHPRMHRRPLARGSFGHPGSPRGNHRVAGPRGATQAQRIHGRTGLRPRGDVSIHERGQDPATRPRPPGRAPGELAGALDDSGRRGRRGRPCDGEAPVRAVARRATTASPTRLFWVRRCPL